MDDNIFGSYTDLLNSASLDSQFDETPTPSESPAVEV